MRVRELIRNKVNEKTKANGGLPVFLTKDEAKRFFKNDVLAHEYNSSKPTPLKNVRVVADFLEMERRDVFALVKLDKEEFYQKLNSRAKKENFFKRKRKEDFLTKNELAEIIGISTKDLTHFECVSDEALLKAYEYLYKDKG